MSFDFAYDEMKYKKQWKAKLNLAGRFPLRATLDIWIYYICGFIRTRNDFSARINLNSIEFSSGAGSAVQVVESVATWAQYGNRL